MVKHIVDFEKCKGCGDCVEICGLQLWELEKVDGRVIPVIIEEAADICHMCLCCRDACPEDALTIMEEKVEDNRAAM